jgi:hypothetical protein
MDGASNNWIARKAQQIIDTIGPKFLVAHWSYISRREANLDQVREDLWQTFYEKIADPAWPRCHWTEINNLPQVILKELNEVFGGWSQDRVHDEDQILASINSSNEEDVEFQRDKKFQYYKAGELTQKTKGLDLQDMEERARKAAEHEQMRQIAIDNGEEEDVISEEYDSDVFSDSGAIVEKFGP